MTERFLKPDAEKIAEALKFIRGFSSVVLGSVTQSGQPHTSYAPHITDAGNFYIYVSTLAQHAETLSNGGASLFFIESERQAESIFARKRLTIYCRVSSISRENQHYDRLLDALQARHGSMLKLLRRLADFNLIQLTPKQASFVTGFGAAYDLSGALSELTKTAG
jgi:putative heme iron utilization protein